jgi:hypothetical protein
MTQTGNTDGGYQGLLKEHTGLGVVLAGKLGDWNSPDPVNGVWEVGDPAEIVESGTMAGGIAGIAVGGNESMGGICDIGTGVFLGMTGEFTCDDPPDESPDTNIGTGW